MEVRKVDLDEAEDIAKANKLIPVRKDGWSRGVLNPTFFRKEDDELMDNEEEISWKEVGKVLKAGDLAVFSRDEDQALFIMKADKLD